MRNLLLLLLLANPMFARAVYSNWCMEGNGQILTSGILSSSTTPVQRSYPGCTITIFLSDGATLATIYSDNSGTVKANPFTLSGTNGRYSFYADQGFYVVRTANTGLTTFTFNIFVPLDGSAGGFISSLNGLTATTQTFATGTTGTDFGIVSSGTVHTFNLPTASSTNRGALSAADWTAFNAKMGALIFTAPLVNTSGTVALTLPITIARGGCGQITQILCFDALAPTTTAGDTMYHNGTNNIRLPIGTAGWCYQSTGTAPVWANVCPTLPVTVPNGGLGVVTLTGFPYGAGTSPVASVSTTTPFQALRLKANQTTVTYEFATPPYLVSGDFNFPSQAPGGTLTATVGASVTLTPCPLGVNGADPTHYLYISAGTGSAEAVLLTGGSCTSGATTGTVTFTPANNHSGAWTVTSATSGIQEAVCATSTATPEVTIRGASTLNANVSYCGKTTVDLVVSAGATFSGTGVLLNATSNTTYNLDSRSDPQLFAQTASVTVASTASETTLIGSGVGSVTLPANFFTPGKTLKVRMFGFHSAVSTPTIDFKIKIGGTTMLDTGVVATGNSMNQVFSVEAYITCRTVGATGTVIGQGWYAEIGNATTPGFSMLNTTTTTIDTTGTLAMNVTVQWGTSSASNTITATNFTLENVP